MKKQIMFFATNIKKLRERRKWSQAEMAKKMGITRIKLAKLELGTTKNPPLADLVNFSALLGIGIDTLLKVDLRKMSELIIKEFEEGNDTYVTGTKIRVHATTVNDNNENNIELVPEKAKAGYRSGGYGDPEWIAELPRYSVPGLMKHRKYRIFPIVGDSMLPYQDGCLVVGEYVEDWINLKNETLCILILKSGSTDLVFKQVENRIKKEKKLLAKSLNLVYKPYEINVSDVLEVWKYKLHIADTITCPVTATDITNEQLLRMMQEMKLELEKLSSKAKV